MNLAISRFGLPRLLVGAFLVFNLMIVSAQAVPNLQIYIPGATYDTATETWVIESLAYDLWVVGARDEIFDVKAAFAVPTDENGSIEVTWLKGSVNWSGYLDNSAAVVRSTGSTDTLVEGGDAGADPYKFVASGTPVMGDGGAVPPHGVFPTSYYEYYIGDFGTSETVANYIPGDTGTASGEIKQFHVVVSGYSWVDIVAYDHVVQTNEKIHSVFSPFSHDGGGGGGTNPNAVPEPATILLLGTGLMAVGRGARKRKTAR